MRRWLADTGWRHLVGFFMLAFALFPLVFVISASLNPRGTLTASAMLFDGASLDNYLKLFTSPTLPYTRWFANTMIIAGATAVLTVLLAASAAYYDSSTSRSFTLSDFAHANGRL